MSTNSSWVRNQYPGAQNRVYLDAAAVGLISLRVCSEINRVADEHAQLGATAGVNWREALSRSREVIARLINGKCDNVAFTQNTSTGLSLVVNGLDWMPGDNVVVPAAEFPSNFYPWTTLRGKGVQIREIPMTNGAADLSQLDNLCDSRTRVVAISAVQYSSGYRYNLARIGEFCRQRDTLFVVDGTQAVGAMVVDVDTTLIDVLSVSAHKWMLGPFGAAFVHLSDRSMNMLTPSTVGWLSVQDPFAFTHEPQLARDARRFESGTENATGIAGLTAAAEFVLELGRSQVQQTVLDMTCELGDLLQEAGLRLTRGPDQRHWSGILIADAGQSNEALHERLSDAGVQCSLRGGGIRFSPHYYNTTDDFTHTASLINRAASQQH